MGYGLHSFQINRLEAKHKTEIEAQRLVLTKSCEADKAITEKVDNGYQKNISSLHDRVADARRLLSSCQLSIKGNAASGYDGDAKRKEPLGSGLGRDRQISSEKFIDLIAEGEKYRVQLLACQAFVNATKEPAAVK